MIKLFRFLFLGLTLIFNQQAACELKLTLTPESAAKMNSQIFNEASTVGRLISKLSQRWTIEEENGIKELLKKHNVAEDMKLPTAFVKGNILRFSGSDLKIVYLENGTFRIGERVFERAKNNEPLDIQLNSLFPKTKENPKVSKLDSIFRVLFNFANATNVGGDTLQKMNLLAALVSLNGEITIETINKSKTFNVSCLPGTDNDTFTGEMQFNVETDGVSRTVKLKLDTKDDKNRSLLTCKELASKIHDEIINSLTGPNNAVLIPKARTQ